MEIGKLGFGLMRLPKKLHVKIDIDQTKKMVDEFLSAGMNYFDTAFIYDAGLSEKAAKEALVDRYPRESFALATKLNALAGCHNEKTAKQEFFTSLERTGAEYFDYYLLHAVQSNNCKVYDKYNLWDFVREQKEKGLVKNWGFSYHSGPEFLDELLTVHPDVDFVQLQINYVDWEDAKNQSRANYEVARKHNKPIVVMEPVKGGSLANPPKKVQEVLKEADESASFASWAIRFAASLDGVLTVLSGMSNIEQMRDNLSYMKNFKPLTEKEREALNKARDIMAKSVSIACTGCRYCTAGCPEKIPIPDIFAARNKQTVWGQIEEGKEKYENAVKSGGRASDCIECGQCERACPQHIEVIEKLKECSKIFDA